MSLEAVMRRLEKRLKTHENQVSLLRREVSGLRTSIGRLIEERRRDTDTLSVHNDLYMAASQRADVAEDRATRAEAQLEKLGEPEATT